MTTAKSSRIPAGFLERKIFHPYALQCLSGTYFVYASNKILSGEFGIIPFRRGEKVIIH